MIIIAISEEEDVVFVRQYRAGAGEIMTELPAGYIDKGEKPEQAAKRELLEETGFEARRWMRLGDFTCMPGKTRNRVHCFLAEGLKEGKPSFDEGEDIEVLKIPIKRISSEIERGKIRCAETLAALVLAKKYIPDIL